MPELPEIETVKNVIEPQIQGIAIEKVTVNRPEVDAHPGAEEFCRDLTGQIISRMGRRGKFLLIWLKNNSCIVLHLRMTGCLLLTPADILQERDPLTDGPKDLSYGVPAGHTHVVLSLNDGRELRFSDTRRFGRFWLLKEGERDTYSGIGKLGIEPFDGELTAQYLRSRLGKRRKAVKGCLLDQTIIAGIGNIYSDEILFAAGIYPGRPANSLEMADWERLAAVIPERLLFFIEKNKISPEEYLQSKGRDYRNTPFLKVYGHAGEPCPKCASVLKRMVVGGRGSVYCPGCQREF